jgi:alanine racemase
MPRPIEARIDLAALRHNYLEAKRRVPQSKAWAVVKANAYGHGLERACRALGDVADGFALLDLDEAVRVRQLGLTQPILLLEGFFEPADLDVLKAQQVSCTVHCRQQLEVLLARPDVVLPIFIKFNSGMNRLGFGEADLSWLAERLPKLRHAGLSFMTHFADADGARGVDWQLAQFRRLTSAWKGPQFTYSVCNSAAILRFPDAGGSWVRPGIMLYGGSPFKDQSAAALDLQPVMTLTSRIIAVQDLVAGAAVGYGCTFTASCAMRIGIVACGYADGYPRHAGSGTPVLVDGVPTRTVGRVSMDMLAVDLSALPQATIGSRVTLWGNGLPADEVAAVAGTISYELFCALAARVPVRES